MTNCFAPSTGLLHYSRFFFTLRTCVLCVMGVTPLPTTTLSGTLEVRRGTRLTNFRLFQTENILQTTISNLMKMAERSQNRSKTLWEKEKLLVTSNFSFSHSVFKRLVLQTRKDQGLFGKGLNKTYNQPIKVLVFLFLYHKNLQ